MLFACGKDADIQGVTIPEWSEEEAAIAGTILSKSEESVTVHILGAVTNPGVYELTEGDRVVDAITAAGGFLPQACETWLNQARLLTDGEQIYVPTTHEVDVWMEDGSASGRTEASAQKTDGGMVNINRATVQDFMTLPGIGESKAKSIVAYREENGDFSQIEDLMNVPGIKEGIYNQIKDLIVV